MTQAPSQTLAVGQHNRPAWSAGLGFSGVPMSYPLAKCYGLLVGEQNSGKSYIMQSNPDCFIINCDLSSTVISGCPATIWPGIGADGNPMGVDGRPFVLTWEHIENVLKHLCTLATENKPRPTTVVIDTLNTLIPILQPYVAHKLNRPSWAEAHGQLAWDRLYGMILETAALLRRHGYGVWIIAHLKRDWVNISETSKVEDYALAMGPGLRDRLTPLVEWVIPIVSSKDVETYTDNVQVRGPDGKMLPPQKMTKSRVINKRTIAFNDPRFTRIVRTRTTSPMPDLDITNAPDPWALLVRAHEQCLNSSSNRS